MIRGLALQFFLWFTIFPSFSQTTTLDIDFDNLSQYNKDLKKNWDTYLAQDGDWRKLYQNTEYAFDCRNIFIIEYLVHLGKLNIDSKIDSVHIPFSQGCLCGSKYLIQKGLVHKIDIDRQYQNKMSALMLAIKNGNIHNFNLILVKKPNVNLINEDGENALLFAIKYSNNIGFIKDIMTLGANVLIKDSIFNFNSLELAHWKKEKEIFKYLLNYYLDKKDTVTLQKSYILDKVIFSGETSYIKKLFPLCEPEKNRSKSEHYIDLVGEFAKMYNLLNKYRDNPLPAMRGSSLYDTKDLDLAVFDILINYGYDINVIDSSGQNVLFKCRNIKAVAKYLVNHNININCVDNTEKTALEYFIDEIIKPETVNINGEEVSTESNDRDYRDQIDLLKFYIENKAFVGKRKESGWRYIYDQAQSHNNSFLLKYLKKHHAKALKEQGLL
jgi:ankyrin repeat protein